MAKSHIEIAKQLKQNSAEIKNYFEDLYAWQSDIREKEEQAIEQRKNAEGKSHEKGPHEKPLTGKKDDVAHWVNRNGDLCKIGGDNVSNEQESNPNRSRGSGDTSLKRDCNSIDSYYSAWEKLNIENIDSYVETRHAKNWKDVNSKICKGGGGEEVDVGGRKSTILHSMVEEAYLHPQDSEERIPANGQAKANEHEHEHEHEHEQENQNQNQNESAGTDYAIEKEKSSHLTLGLSREEGQIVKKESKVLDIYRCKSEEGKINYKNKEYHKCLENYNDIINYIDFEIKNYNIFLEIEKNYDNELYMDVRSNNYVLENKKVEEELLVLRTKTLINRSLIFQRLSCYNESIKDCTCIILFYTYFLPKLKNYIKYCIRNSFTVNIMYIIFKAYYLRGMARYKLKIFKLSLKDFKESKEFTKEISSSTSINVDRSIKMIENIIKENNVKKYNRRQCEYTSTLMERYKTKPRPLKICLISKDITKEVIPSQNEHDNSGGHIPQIENLKEQKVHMCTTGENLVYNREDAQTSTRKKSTENKNYKLAGDMDNIKHGQNENKLFPITMTQREVLTQANEEKPKGNMHRCYRDERSEEGEREESTFNIEDAISESSVTLYENQMLSDVEDTEPKPLFTSSEKNKEKGKIKNKINFEILWNSDRIKNSIKNQIDILKIAFLEEAIFNFDLDKDIYVDILDSLFKGSFLSLFENEDCSHDEYVKRHFQKCGNTMNTPCEETKITGGYESEANTFVGVKQQEADNTVYKLNCDDCAVLVEILYLMTNCGREGYVFLFIDKKERNILEKLYNFILAYPNIFFCSENCIKEKTLLLKDIAKTIEIANTIKIRKNKPLCMNTCHNTSDARRNETKNFN
ncbi:conserved Plasmodium protein, unknown function [Plasmodium ovale wallikeri]|uniref:Uncharacterized protein n=1 Tax=Plasmodium ovale wallikeri TaxID=864142 RepID=A0A1A8ZV18_PLAOA|nr:conserved Plasmodium protein, unknown function [Plasmodium ovale wallikeri]